MCTPGLSPFLENVALPFLCPELRNGCSVGVLRGSGVLDRAVAAFWVARLQRSGSRGCSVLGRAAAAFWVAGNRFTAVHVVTTAARREQNELRQKIAEA